MFTVQHLPGATQYQPSERLTATERPGWRYSKPSSLRLRHHTQQSSKHRFLCLQNKSCIWPLLPIALSPTSTKRHPPKSQSLRSQVTEPSPFLWFPPHQSQNGTQGQHPGLNHLPSASHCPSPLRACFYHRLLHQQTLFIPSVGLPRSRLPAALPPGFCVCRVSHTSVP